MLADLDCIVCSEVFFGVSLGFSRHAWIYRYREYEKIKVHIKTVGSLFKAAL